MAKIKVRVERSREVAASPGDVFLLLADVPDSVAHFPSVESLTPEAGGYRWTMEATSVAGIRVQTVYACRYHADPDALRVRWEPIPGIGNAQVHGAWDIQACRQGSRVSLATEFEIEVDLPFFLRGPAKPFVKGELERLLDTYMDNLARTFGGGDGRVHPSA